MSTILKALKKSEAERREGGPPPPAAYSGTSSGHRVPWLAGGVALGVAAAAIFLGLWARSPTTPAGDVEPLVGVGPQVSADPDKPAGQVPPAAVAGPAPELGAEAPKEPPPAPAAAERTQIAEAPPPRPVAVDVPPAVDTPAPTSPPRPAADLSPAIAAASSPPGQAQPPASSGPAPAAVAEDLPRYSQLPGLRSQLGDLNLTMLVYSSEPRRRLALINGERLREGDTVNELTVVAIRRDGCVLQSGSRRFLLSSQQ